MRIRSRLLLLVASVLVPALLGSAAAVAYIYHEEKKFHHASMRETAQALALALDRDMGRRHAILRTLAASPALAMDDLARFHAFASAVAGETDAAIILSDLHGRQLVNTRLPFGAALPPMLPMEREYRAREGNEPTLMSDLYIPPPGLGGFSFAVQIPVRRDGQVRLFLSMAAFASQLQKLLAEQHLPPGWHASIVDRKGVVMARSSEPEKYVGQPVRAELASKIAAQAEGFHEGTTLAGVRGTAFFSRAPQSGWTFLVSVPDAALYGPVIRATALLAAVSLLLLGLGLAAALLAAARISRTIEALRASADRLGRNEPLEFKPSATLELDAVHQAMAEAGSRLRGSTAELERRVAEALENFEHSQRALLQAQKLEALGRLTGGIAHDFNNVLQTLTTGLQVLKHDAGPQQAELVKRCERAVARGTELARQLMAFGRVQEVRVETLDTAAWLLEARGLLQGALPSNIVLDCDLMPGLWPVDVDPAQLELALLNLVINARDAMRSGGSIVLRGSNESLRSPRHELQPGDYAVLTLADTGEGMSREVLAHALDPFYTTKGVGHGSGMGLPQAYGFARQNGGTLVLESKLGYGTTARLYLPRSHKLPTAAAPAGPLPALPTSKGKVLLVEDDELVRETVSAALRAAGFEIHTAENADDALHRLDGGDRFDAVLTDVVMPGALTGLDLAEHILRNHPGTGVVVATGYSDRKVHLAGVRALPKPYDLQQAVDALNDAVAG